jgi:hypothetical protein
VQIDQTRRNDVTRRVAHIGSGIGLELASDYDHLAARKGDIRHGVSSCGRSITRLPRRIKSKDIVAARSTSMLGLILFGAYMLNGA